MANLQKTKKEEMFGGSRQSKDQRKESEKDEANTADLNDLSNEVVQLEKDIDQLRATYEIYFMGVEKNEPTIARDKIKSAIRRLKEVRTRNTAVRFRIQQVHARMVSLESYWGRILQQREAGTYKRDVARVKRRDLDLAKKTAPAIPEAPASAEAPSSNAASPAIPSVAVGKPPPAPPLRRPTATSPDDLTDTKLRKLYETYLSARKRCGETVDLRYEEMATALRSQVPTLMKSTGAKAVEFKVVIRDGHAILKALPKD